MDKHSDTLTPASEANQQEQILNLGHVGAQTQVRVSNLINASPDEHSDTSTPASEPNQNQQMLDPRHVGAQPRASVERPFAFTFVSAFPIMVDKHKCSMPDNARPNGALKLC